MSRYNFDTRYDPGPASQRQPEGYSNYRVRRRQPGERGPGLSQREAEQRLLQRFSDVEYRGGDNRYFCFWVPTEEMDR